jgi:hypothetical protein
MGKRDKGKSRQREMIPDNEKTPVVASFLGQPISRCHINLGALCNITAGG